MKFTVFRGLFGGLAGAFAALTASLTYASPLNHDLQIALDPPQPVVLVGIRDSVPDTRPRVMKTAQLNKPAPRLGVVDQPTPAELAGRSLKPGASDPDVPLPHPSLSEEFSDRTDATKPLTGPTPFGRGESGGGVLGLRMPIPAQRIPSGQATTSGGQ